jgi:hypothetical protein
VAEFQSESMATLMEKSKNTRLHQSYGLENPSQSSEAHRLPLCGGRLREPNKGDATRFTTGTPLPRNEGEAGVDQEFAAKSLDGIGAFILGRNMFGPVRGSWPDESWIG